MTRLKSYIEWFIVISTIILGFSWYIVGDFLPSANASMIPLLTIETSTKFSAKSSADQGENVREYTQEELAKISDKDLEAKVYDINNLTSSQILTFNSAFEKEDVLGIIVFGESEKVLNTAIKKIAKINGKKCILTIEKSNVVQLSTGDLLNQIKTIGFETCPEVSEEASQPVE